MIGSVVGVEVESGLKFVAGSEIGSVIESDSGSEIESKGWV